MKPAAFDYVRAETLAEVHATLAAEGGQSRVIAGGQTLLPMLSMRLARPDVVVDIMGLSELGGISLERDAIRVGASVRQAELLAWPQLAEQQPLLAAVLPWVGHAQTRSRGTVCGSIAHADPSAELPLALMALGGTVELSSKRRRRNVAAADFFTGLMTTARADDELIEAVRFPCQKKGHGYAFREFGRRHGDFAIVACAVIVHDRGLTFAVGGVADRPMARSYPVLEGGALDEALDALAWELEARDDLHASARFRRDLVRRMGRETINEARRCRV
jgi:2-furoyl-CoA dehydrogenase FAD binding subunit